MFFARTQAPHEWNSPVYRFSRRQRAAWDALWRAAEGRTHPGRPEPIQTEGPDDPADRLQPVEARCLVFQKGRVVESGTHESLLARKGRYADMWKKQCGGKSPDHVKTL
jgi:hypothetical protein